MKEYVKISKEQTCSVTLADLESKRNKFEFINNTDLLSAKTYMDLVLYSPSAQSHLGIKPSTKIVKHIDELVNDLVKALGIKHIYFFTAYTSDNKDKKNLNDMVKNDNYTFLLMYSSGSFVESLYASIRNALSHGNIVKKGKLYFLYSVNSKEGRSVQEKERKLSFLLKLYSLEKLNAYIDVFEMYN